MLRFIVKTLLVRVRPDLSASVASSRKRKHEHDRLRRDSCGQYGAHNIRNMRPNGWLIANKRAKQTRVIADPLEKAEDGFRRVMKGESGEVPFTP